MLLAFIDNSAKTTILWAVLVCAALGLIALVAYVVTSARKGKKGDSPIDAVSTEEDELPVETDETNDYPSVTELVMSRNVIYSAGVEGNFKAGKYIMESADDSTAKFNVRVNGLVREYEGGDAVTLTDGDTISPVSGAVIITAVGD